MQALQNLERMDKLLALIHASFLAKVSIKLAEASNDTNLVIGRLTTFATVLLPMNLVTGLWGKRTALYFLISIFLIIVCFRHER